MTKMQQKVRENHLKLVYIVPGYSIAGVCARVCIFVFLCCCRSDCGGMILITRSCAGEYVAGVVVIDLRLYSPTLPELIHLIKVHYELLGIVANVS